MSAEQSAASTGVSRWPRVLLVTPQPFYEDRGTPIALRDTARALCEMGYAVDMLAFPMGKDVAIEGLHVHRCRSPLDFESVPIGFSLKKLVLDAGLMRDFEDRLSMHHYDIVHAVEEAAYMASVLCPRFDVPYVYDMASSIPTELKSHPLFGGRVMQSLLKAAERRVISRAAHVMCSAGLSRYVQRQFDRVPVIEWMFPALLRSVDGHLAERVRRDMGFDRSHRVVLYSGNFAGYQSIDTLMQAFEIAQRRDGSLRLVCVGATQEERERWSQALAPDTAGKVTILTRRPRHQIPVYLQMADCLVSLRRRSDNLPLKVFEYMASGTPIVATRGPAHEPTLNDQRAYLCDGDAGAVAGAMLSAVRSPDHAASVAVAARRYASRHFGWDSFKALVGRAYDRALVEHHSEA